MSNFPKCRGDTTRTMRRIGGGPIGGNRRTWIDELIADGALEKVPPYRNEQGYLSSYRLTDKGREWLRRLRHG